MTSLQGRVVDKKMGALQYWTWLRHLFSVPNAKLRLHDYNAAGLLKDRPTIAETESDSDGQFRFDRIAEGHYTLEIQSADYYDSFDIEVTKNIQETGMVMIDVSPHFPDCKGGDEFKVRYKS